jgi:hypothetical protein
MTRTPCCECWQTLRQTGPSLPRRQVLQHLQRQRLVQQVEAAVAVAQMCLPWMLRRQPSLRAWRVSC